MQNVICDNQYWHKLIFCNYNISWVWLTNAPMPQLLSVFGCVLKAKLLHFDWLRHYRSISNSHQVAKFAGFVNLFISFLSQINDTFG